MEQKEYEQKLFKKEEAKEGNMSEISQQSSESMSQYDQLENVYAPSATPCYDTPGHNSDNQQPDASKMCYVDVAMDNERMDTEGQVDSNENSQKSGEPSNENKTLRKRNLDGDNVCKLNTMKYKRVDDTSKVVVSGKKRTTEAKKEKGEASQEAIPVEKSKLQVEQKRDSVPNTQSTTEENNLNTHLKEESKELENGSRSLSNEEQKERQRCKLSSDNT